LESAEINKYMFVKISVLRTKRGKVVIQIKDISENVLNKQMKAERVLLTLINATVSHELRNPLNAMIGQICAMEGAFICFKEMIDRI
jgi:signal transduction histidine kinase